MIWFKCKSCGKRHRRQEGESGTLVFCECGTGNRVPWENTTAVDEEPLEINEEAATRPRSLGAFPRDDSDATADDHPRPRRRRWQEVVRRDPAFCFNHQDVTAPQTCADCGEKFCERCVVCLKGQVLCSPCKNLRLQRVHRSVQLSMLALFSPIVSFTGGAFAMGLASAAVQAGTPGLAVIGMAPQLVSMVLGFMALRRIETNAEISGRSLAITGIVASFVGVILTWAMVFIMEYGQAMKE